MRSAASVCVSSSGTSVCCSSDWSPRSSSRGSCSFARLDRQIERDLAQEVEELRQLAEDGNNPQTGEPFNDDAAAIFDTFLERNVPLTGEAFFTIVDGQPYRFSLDRSWAGCSTTPRRRCAVGGRRGPPRLDLSTIGRRGEDARGAAAGRRAPTAACSSSPSFPRRSDRRSSTRPSASSLPSAACRPRAHGRGGVEPRRAGRCGRCAELTATAQRITESDTLGPHPGRGPRRAGRARRTPSTTCSTGSRPGSPSAAPVPRRRRPRAAHPAHHRPGPPRGARRRSRRTAPRRSPLVTDELDRMGRYVEDLLLLAKAEEHDFLRLGPVDVGELVARPALAGASALGAARLGAR